MIQLEVHDVEHTALSRQLLVMLLCLIVHRRHRYIITHRRIRTQPPTVLRIKVSRTVVVEPGFLILLLRSKLVRPAVVRIAEIYFICRLRGMSVRQVAHILFIRRLLLYP